MEVVKDFLDPLDPQTGGMEIVRLARERYVERYGRGAPIVDSSDAKSAIYLVNATTAGCSAWLSLRLVPAAGRPQLTDDLRFHRLGAAQQSPLERLVAAGFAADDADAIDRTFSISRIASFCERGDAKADLPQDWVAKSIALVVDVFLQNCVPGPPPILTMQMATMLVRKLPGLPLVAFDMATGGSAGEVSLDRAATDVRTLCYEHPAYFLDAPALARLIMGHVARGTWTRDQVTSLLPKGRPFETFVSDPRFSDLRDLAPLLRDEAIRAEADEQVPDATELWLYGAGAIPNRPRAGMHTVPRRWNHASRQVRNGARCVQAAGLQQLPSDPLRRGRSTGP